MEEEEEDKRITEKVEDLKTSLTAFLNKDAKEDKHVRWD